jgi:hypothetical protein
MKVVRYLVLCAALNAASAMGASSMEHKAGNDELVTLYLLSVAADRCGFPMSARQADRIDQETNVLVEKLKLGSRETDALYSEADVKFEHEGPKACDRSGNFAKQFRQTLQRLTGP